MDIVWTPRWISPVFERVRGRRPGLTQFSDFVMVLIQVPSECTCETSRGPQQRFVPKKPQVAQ